MKKDDTLLAIAYRFGVTLKDLMAANPDVDPRLLNIGQRIVIPLFGGEDLQGLLPTPTAVPVELSDVSCHRTPSNGLWCLTSVTNPLGKPVDSVSALISLADAEGTILASLPAFSPLNLLPPEGRLPLVVHFDPPAPEYSNAAARLLGALEVGEASKWYLELRLSLSRVEPGVNGRYWLVSGMASLPEGFAKSAAGVRVLAMGFDAEDQLAGFSVWDSDDGLQPGEQTAFTISVFALGEPIDRVEVIAEGQAAD